MFEFYSCKNNSIRVMLNGGLGNQLFQFAAGVSLALETRSKIQFLTLSKTWPSRLDSIGLRNGVAYEPSLSFGSLMLTEQVICKICKFKKYEEQKFSYDKIQVVETHKELTGYFQSEKYFVNHKKIIRDFLRERTGITQSKTLHTNIIHLRMGDYARNPEVRKIHGLIGAEYINAAVKRLGLNLGDFALASDDFESIEREYPSLNLSLLEKTCGKSDLEDLRIMAMAKNLIISNSTFGWWAAYLGSARCVAPEKWFTPEGMSRYSTKDLFVSDWEII